VEDQVSDEPDVAGRVIALFEEVRGYALNVAESRKGHGRSKRRRYSDGKASYSSSEPLNRHERFSGAGARGFSGP
jgi:hypothetical protein